MANIIKCNTGTLTTDQGDVTHNLNLIKNGIAALRTISTRLDNMWDGDASVAYKAKLDRYIQELENMCNSVASIAAYEGKAITEYNKCEGDISGIIASVNV